jgi:hypothetical protein
MHALLSEAVQVWPRLTEEQRVELGRNALDVCVNGAGDM